MPRTIRASSHSRTLVTGEPPLTATTVAPAATPASSSATAVGRPASSSGAANHNPHSAPAGGAWPGGEDQEPPPAEGPPARPDEIQDPFAPGTSHAGEEIDPVTRRERSGEEDPAMPAPEEDRD